MSRAEAPLWVVRQDFVKFGKKEVYEKQIAIWNQAFSHFAAGKEAAPVFAFQDSEGAQYLYFTPFSHYGALDGYLNSQRLFRESLEMKDLLLVHNTTLNFYMQSIHEFLPQCSTLSAPTVQAPFAHYYVYAVIPGGESVFEERLVKLAAKHKAQWCTWKVVFDSDVPKYVIYLWAKNEEELARFSKEVTFVEPRDKEILRRERDGRVKLRPELSSILK